MMTLSTATLDTPPGGIKTQHTFPCLHYFLGFLLYISTSLALYSRSSLTVRASVLDGNHAEEKQCFSKSSTRLGIYIIAVLVKIIASGGGFSNWHISRRERVFIACTYSISSINILIGRPIGLSPALLLSKLFAFKSLVYFLLINDQLDFFVAVPGWSRFLFQTSSRYVFTP
jgi:hypothetical protein